MSTSRIVLSTSSSGIEYLVPNIRNLPLETIRLHVKINNVMFDDGFNLNPSVLSNIMVSSPKSIASTFPASESELTDLFLKLYERQIDEVFVVCISSQFSESYQILQKVKAAFNNRMNIYLYDAKTLNLPEAALAYEAALMVKQGKTFAEIVERLDAIRAGSHFFFTLYELDYIIKNKKVSVPAGFIANLFGIRPIMEINQAGQIVPFDKVRKISRALSCLGDIIKERTADKESFIYIASGGHSEDIQYFASILEKHCGLTKLPVIPVSSISLANHGPRGMAIGAFVGEIPSIVQFYQEHA